jgi:hypothetical protein
VATRASPLRRIDVPEQENELATTIASPMAELDCCPDF